MAHHYAILLGSVIVNTAMADAPVTSAWINIEYLDPRPAIGWVTTDGGLTFQSPPQPEPKPTQVDPTLWLIDIGPFTDRFGSKKLLVDMSTDPFVIAFDKDLGRRKWIDLKRSDVAIALNYLSGDTIPGVGTIAAPILTHEEVATILTTPVAPQENLALRKLYF